MHICPKYKYCHIPCKHRNPHKHDDVECANLKRYEYKNCPDSCIEVETVKCPNTHCVMDCLHKKEHIKINGCCESDECPECVPTIISDVIFTEKDFSIDIRI